MLEVGNGGMTDTEYRTHFTLWAMMAAPLLIGTDLRTASAATLTILGNRDVIAVDQDPRGAQAARCAQAGGLHVLSRPLANGDFAVALFNETGSTATISTTRVRPGCRTRRPTGCSTCGPRPSAARPERSAPRCRRTRRSSTG
jgi:alpha-galactosidase